MSSEYIKKINTNEGPKQIDYLSLANIPSFDTTLTISGAIADAKAVGDRITKLENQITQLKKVLSGQ